MCKPKAVASRYPRSSAFLFYIERRTSVAIATLAYYKIQVGHPLSNVALDAVTQEIISGLVTKSREAGHQVSSINRALQVLRRMLRLAVEWGKVGKAAPRVSLLPGERRRERVVIPTEEAAYLDAARNIGESILEDYRRALQGIRATERGQQPTKPDDPFLLRDVATILPVPYISPMARRPTRGGQIPYRSGAVLEMRRSIATSEWIFPGRTKSGHIEQSTLKKPHLAACELAGLEQAPFYTFRHTCLTRWAAHIDPYSLAYFAGHSDFGTTRRYVHPSLDTGREAMERAGGAQGGHNSGHSAEIAILPGRSAGVVVQ